MKRPTAQSFLELLKAARMVYWLISFKWAGARCRVVVDGEVSGVRVDIRTSRSDASTSLLPNRQPGEVTREGKVTLFLDDDGNIGREAEVVVLDASGRVIDSELSVLGQ